MEVTFPEAVTNLADLEITIAGLEVTNKAVKQTDSKTVVLTTAAQTAGTTYAVSVNGAVVGSFAGISAVIPTSVDVVNKAVQGKLGQQVTVQAKVTVAAGQSASGIPVTFNIPGYTDNSVAPVTAEAVTNADGVASYTYTRYTATNDQVTAYATGDRSKFSIGYVFWGVDSILTVTEVTEGATINNGSSKTYKVVYKNQTTGKVEANKRLQVSFLENINATVDKTSNAKVNGDTPVQYANGSETDSVEIYTDAKGEATFTVSGVNTEVTPVVFDGGTSALTVERYETSKLQAVASKVKFAAIQAEYVIDITRDGDETAAVGVTNGREYTVTVKDKDGKPAKNEVVQLAFDEDLDRVISTNTDAEFIDYDAADNPFFTGDTFSVKTNDKGEATFEIGTRTNTKDYATPVAWIDINNSNANTGKFDEGEPSKKGPISYFTTATLSAGKLVSKNDATSVTSTKLLSSELARFEYELTNQSGKKINLADTGYEKVEVTYTVTNTGKNDILVSGHALPVSPNRTATVTVTGYSSIPAITVKSADGVSTTSAEVTATAVLTDTSYATGQQLRPFTIGRTTATAVTFTKATEVPAKFTGYITGYNETAKTVTFTDVKGTVMDAVKYVVAGKTVIFKGPGTASISTAADFLELIKTNKVYATYTVDGDTITFEVITAGTGTPATSTEVAKLVSASTTKAAGTYTSTDGTVNIDLTFDSAVNVTGTPTLALNVGGTTATYVSGSGTNKLTFSYAIGATDDTAASDLAVSAVTLGGGTIVTKANTANAATLTIASPLVLTGVKIAPYSAVATGVSASKGIQLQAGNVGAAAVPPVKQVIETVFGAATTAGNIDVTVGTQTAVTVAVATGDTADTVAGKVATAIATAATTEGFTATSAIGGKVILTADVAEADETVAITSVDTDTTGVAIATASATTINGVAAVAAIPASKQKDQLKVTASSVKAGKIAVTVTVGGVAYTEDITVSATDTATSIAAAIKSAFAGKVSGWTVTVNGTEVEFEANTAASDVPFLVSSTDK